MKYLLTFLLLLLKFSDLTSQILAIDTLVIFTHKYELSRTKVYLTGSNKSFLSTTPCNYNVRETIHFKYLTQSDNKCKSETSYDAEGRSYTTSFCVGKREKEDYLIYCIDSIKIDYSKLNYNSIKLKQNNKTYYFDIIEYILQYDTCKITIALNQNAKDNYLMIQNTFMKFGKPRMIILNQLLYIEPKSRIAYDIPLQLVLLDN